MLANTVLLSNDEALASGVARAISDVPHARLSVHDPRGKSAVDRHRTAAFIVHHSQESDLDSLMQG